MSEIKTKIEKLNISKGDVLFIEVAADIDKGDMQNFKIILFELLKDRNISFLIHREGDIKSIKIVNKMEVAT